MTITSPEDTGRLMDAGDILSLKSLDPTATKLIVAAGWDIVGFEENGVDVDLSALMLTPAGQTRMDSDFIFYNNEQSAEGAIVSGGDNRTGAGDGDDETLLIGLAKIPMDIGSVAIIISLYDGDLREHNFRKIRNAFIRVMNADRQGELLRLILDPLLDLHADTTGAIVLTLERDISGWAFRATCDFKQGGLGKIAQDAGIEVI